VHTYFLHAGVELAVLSGHPEEVYGLKFISNSTSSNTNAAATAMQQHASQSLTQQPSSSSNSVSNMLVTASGESLFLWDLHTGQMLQECAPLPVAGMSGLNVNDSQPSQRKNDRKDGSKWQQAATGGAEEATAGESEKQGSSGDASRPVEQQQQQQQQHAALIEQEDEDYDEEEEVQAGPAMLSYIFSLAAAEGASWLAGSCADGLLRLWDAGHGQLQEVAAVQVCSLVLPFLALFPCCNMCYSAWRNTWVLLGCVVLHQASCRTCQQCRQGYQCAESHALVNMRLSTLCLQFLYCQP
jgi:WD40 repeat protein